jgi:hypothetical protein
MISSCRDDLNVAYLEILFVPAGELAKESNQDLTIHLVCSFFLYPLDHLLGGLQSDFPSTIRELSLEVSRYQVGSLGQRIIVRVTVFDRF